MAETTSAQSEVQKSRHSPLSDFENQMTSLSRRAFKVTSCQSFRYPATALLHARACGRRMGTHRPLPVVVGRRDRLAACNLTGTSLGAGAEQARIGMQGHIAVEV